MKTLVARRAGARALCVGSLCSYMHYSVARSPSLKMVHVLTLVQYTVRSRAYLAELRRANGGSFCFGANPTALGIWFFALAKSSCLFEQTLVLLVCGSKSGPRARLERSQLL